MKTEFDITLTGKDMYRFNIHHAYTSSQGILSILIAAVCFVMAFYARGSLEPMYSFLYAGFGALFCVYLPFQLYLRSRQQILKSEVLKNALHYTIDETGIHTSQNDAAADLPWEQVYKIVSTRHNVLIYSSRINAFVIPRSQIGSEYETIRQIASSNLPKYRFKMK